MSGALALSRTEPRQRRNVESTSGGKDWNAKFCKLGCDAIVFDIGCNAYRSDMFQTF